MKKTALALGSLATVLAMYATPAKAEIVTLNPTQSSFVTAIIISSNTLSNSVIALLLY